MTNDLNQMFPVEDVTFVFKLESKHKKIWVAYRGRGGDVFEVKLL